MVIVVKDTDVKETLDLLAGLGETAWMMGRVATSKQLEPTVVFE